MSLNPFFSGEPVPAERFVGRTSETAFAFDQIHNRSHLAIWGGPGMGKSSFLAKLASPVVWKEQQQDLSQAVIIFFSCQVIHPFTPSNFWRKILTVLLNELNSEPELQTQIETLLAERQVTKDSLRLVLQKLGQRNKFLVLLLDDYDTALLPNEQYTEADMENFLSECRSLAYHAHERLYLSMIVTSLKRLNELGPQPKQNASPWYNHYLFQYLKPFSKTEIAQVFEQLQINSVLQNKIQEIAGGHPALLQIAGFLLYREIETGKNPDIEAFIRDFESSTKHIFQNIWQRCSEVEQTLLMLITLSHLKGRLYKKKNFDLSDIDLIFTQRDRELTYLEEQGVIIHIIHTEKKVEKKIYSFTSSIMERFVIQELWNTNEVSLKAREKVFLNLMNHQQAEQVTNAIRWISQHKDNIPSAFDLIGKFVAALFKIFKS